VQHPNLLLRHQYKTLAIYLRNIWTLKTYTWNSGGGTGYARYALAYTAAPMNILLYIRIAFVFVKRKKRKKLTWNGSRHTKGPLEAPHAAHVAKSSRMHHASTPRNATQLGITFPKSNLDRRRRTDGERDTVTAPAPPDTPTAWRLTVESQRHGEYNYATLFSVPDLISYLLTSQIINCLIIYYCVFNICAVMKRTSDIISLFQKHEGGSGGCFSNRSPVRLNLWCKGRLLRESN
jgi:hypothetical protein